MLVSDIQGDKPLRGIDLRYYLRQHTWARVKQSRVVNRKGQTVFLINRAAGPGQGRLCFRLHKGKEVASIEVETGATGPLYKIHRPGLPLVTVTKQLFTFQEPKFIVDVPGLDDIEAQGDFTIYDYEFRRDSGLIARVFIDDSGQSPTIGIDLEHKDDRLLLLVSVVVIGMASQAEEEMG